MGLFNKNKQQTPTVPVPQPVPPVPQQNYDAAEAQLDKAIMPPVQPEVQYQPQVQESAPQPAPEPKKVEGEKVRVQQVPVFLDQSAVNNLVIENNLMLKELLSLAQE